MIIATVHLHNGESFTKKARSFEELFKQMDTTQIAEFAAKDVNVGNIRQGKDNKKQEGTEK